VQTHHNYGYSGNSSKLSKVILLLFTNIDKNQKTTMLVKNKKKTFESFDDIPEQLWVW
jgi:predicted nucleic acid-binding OB-fold protein